jgi:hypothetical protein
MQRPPVLEQRWTALAETMKAIHFPDVVAPEA